MKRSRDKRELQQVEAHRAQLRALGKVTHTTEPAVPATASGGEDEPLAPVLSLAYRRAVRAGHPSAGARPTR